MEYDESRLLWTCGTERCLSEGGREWMERHEAEGHVWCACGRALSPRGLAQHLAAARKWFDRASHGEVRNPATLKGNPAGSLAGGRLRREM